MTINHMFNHFYHKRNTHVLKVPENQILQVEVEN